MESPVVYADIQLSEDSSLRRNKDSIQRADHQLCPRWHRTVLQVGWAGHILLVMTVIVMGVWVVNTKHTAATAATLYANAHQGSEGNNTLENFKFILKEKLCEAATTLRENRSCDLCPMKWVLHKHKCYWFSNSIQSWGKSKEDCITKKSQLIVIYDQEEMKFIQKHQEKKKTWLGLSVISPEKKWMWLDGSLVNQTLFPKLLTEKDGCGALGINDIYSELCSTNLSWICQKNSILI